MGQAARGWLSESNWGRVMVAIPRAAGQVWLQRSRSVQGARVKYSFLSLGLISQSGAEMRVTLYQTSRPRGNHPRCNAMKSIAYLWAAQKGFLREEIPEIPSGEWSNSWEETMRLTKGLGACVFLGLCCSNTWGLTRVLPSGILLEHRFFSRGPRPGCIVLLKTSRGVR